MSIRIAQAASSEFYSAWGVPGRQRPDELNIQNWSKDDSNPWLYCFRPKTDYLAECIATFFERSVANYNVGYSQNNGASPRTTLYDYAKEKNWDASKVDKPCNTDCTALAGAAIASGGVSDSALRDMYSGNMYDVLKKTSRFDIFFDDAHTKCESNLRRGDLLLRKGHAVCVLDTATVLDTGTFAVIHDCASVNVRSGPGTQFPVISTLGGNSVVPYLSTDPLGWVKTFVGLKPGYVSTKYCQKLQDAFASGNVNIRLTPGIGLVIGVIPINKNCSLMGEEKKYLGRVWYKVFYKGIIGWASSLYIRKL